MKRKSFRRTFSIFNALKRSNPLIKSREEVSADLISIGVSVPSSLISKSTSLPARVAEEVYFRRDPFVESAFYDLYNNKVFIQVATERITKCLFSCVDAYEKSGEARVSEEYFGRLDNTLSDILEERRQFEDYI